MRKNFSSENVNLGFYSSKEARQNRMILPRLLFYLFADSFL